MCYKGVHGNVHTGAVVATIPPLQLPQVEREREPLLKVEGRLLARAKVVKRKVTKLKLPARLPLRLANPSQLVAVQVLYMRIRILPSAFYTLKIAMVLSCMSRKRVKTILGSVLLTKKRFVRGKY